uniref:Uncharacterized protein n=1 Tax=Anopheles merus TaxID=30066 RepID=A0A182VM42_ANOME
MLEVLESVALTIDVCAVDLIPKLYHGQWKPRVRNANCQQQSIVLLQYAGCQLVGFLAGECKFAIITRRTIYLAASEKIGKRFCRTDRNVRHIVEWIGWDIVQGTLFARRECWGRGRGRRKRWWDGLLVSLGFLLTGKLFQSMSCVNQEGDKPHEHPAQYVSVTIAVVLLGRRACRSRYSTENESSEQPIMSRVMVAMMKMTHHRCLLNWM